MTKLKTAFLKPAFPFEIGYAHCNKSHCLAGKISDDRDSRFSDGTNVLTSNVEGFEYSPITNTMYAITQSGSVYELVGVSVEAVDKALVKFETNKEKYADLADVEIDINWAK